MSAYYQHLLSPRLLADHINDDNWVILDCRFDLSDPGAGQKQYEQGHIPGAVYADLEKDLSAPATSQSGRHPLPSPEALCARLSDWGINRSSQVVAYDDSKGAFAARAWWLLRWLGHDHIAVVDGGLSAWRRAGLPLNRTTPTPTPSTFEPTLRCEMSIDADGLLPALENGAVLLDARDAFRFMGEDEPLDKVAGHIPGAHNFPFAVNLDRHGQFLDPSELRLCFDAALAGSRPADVICMCGSGVTACHNLLAMEIAGLPGARLYPGSWSEWCATDKRPIAVGPDV